MKDRIEKAIAHPPHRYAVVGRADDADFKALRERAVRLFHAFDRALPYPWILAALESGQEELIYRKLDEFAATGDRVEDDGFIPRSLRKENT